MEHKLKYRDNRDKTYGLTGMAIALVMADGEDMLMQVSLDAPAGEGITFTPDFYHGAIRDTRPSWPGTRSTRCPTTP